MKTSSCEWTVFLVLFSQDYSKWRTDRTRGWRMTVCDLTGWVTNILECLSCCSLLKTQLQTLSKNSICLPMQYITVSVRVVGWWEDFCTRGGGSVCVWCIHFSGLVTAHNSSSARLQKLKALVLSRILYTHHHQHKRINF